MSKHEPIKDRPCLYFISEHGTREEMANIYYSLAEWCGLSAGDAASASQFYASGRGLFGGQPFTKEELLSCKKDRTPSGNSGKGCSLVQCVGLAGQTKLTQRYCSLCEYSYSYQNYNKKNEEMYLRRMLDNPELAFSVDAKRFKWLYYGAGLKEIDFCPPYPVYRILYWHIKEHKTLDNKTKLVDRAKKYLKDSYNVVNDQYVAESLNVAVKKVLMTTVTMNDDLLVESLIKAPKYVPAVFVRPVADKDGYVQEFFFDNDFEDSQSGDADEEPSLEGANETVDGSSEMSEQPSSEETADAVSTENNRAESVQNTEENVPERKVLLFGTAPDNNAINDTTISESPAEDAPVETMKSDQIAEEVSKPSAENKERAGESVADVTNETPVLLVYGGGDEEPSKTEDEAVKEERSESENSSDIIEENDTQKAAETSENAPESSSEQVEDAPALPPLTHPCDACNFCGRFMELGEILVDEKKKFFDTILASPTEDAPTFYTLQTKQGCAIANKMRRKDDCVYKKMPVISDSFSALILDCSDVKTESFFKFFEEFSKAKDVSVESVIYKNVEGLLFWFDEKFMFFNPKFGYGGYFRTALAKTENRPKYYSINPIPVYAALGKMRIFDIRIESIAGLFSSAHGSYASAPLAAIFQKYVSVPVEIDDLLFSAMPKYKDVYDDYRTNLKIQYLGLYNIGMSLERALGKNYYIDDISKYDVGIKGGNYLTYRLALEKDFKSQKGFSVFTKEGSLFMVTLSDSDQLWQKNFYKVRKFFDALVGNVYAPIANYLESSRIVFLSDQKAAFFVTDEVDAFYDHLLHVARGLYDQVFHDMPSINITRIDYKKVDEESKAPEPKENTPENPAAENEPVQA